ncbi:MAG: exosortase/archaeosortase family protein [Ferruginibacter sp.]|nr:exosortase/archaeosortase family protein [Ferruginibacter sp.]
MFSIFYFGSLIIIGLSAKDGYYSPFISKYFDVISWVSHSLIWGTKGFVYLMGFETYTLPNFIIRIVGGSGVRIAYDCVGYGVMSFWAAFILATAASALSKFKWLIGGLILLWSINVIRIGLLLIAYNKKWSMPFGIDHHTWFNIVAYAAIFLMMYFFDRKYQILQLNVHSLKDKDTRNIQIKIKK